ncbi:MAG: recombinase family protein [Dehalococcoidia bacterium]
MDNTCAIYARISHDEFATEKGVQRQLEDGRALAVQRGWEIRGEYIDNDVSAFKGQARPAYRRLMADAEAGTFGRIIVWQQSRLWRNRVERAHAVEALGRLHVGIEAVRGPSLDLSTASGRLVADLLGSLDTAESAIKSERIMRAARQRAEEGRPHAVTPYGWRRVYETTESGRRTGFHDEVQREQAEVVNEIVDALLTGDSLLKICARLNGRGIPAPRGGPWTHTQVMKLAKRPANVGMRTYRGEVIAAGEWEPIIDPGKYERVIALLAAPERRKSRDGKRRHLLSHSDFAVCGVCGGTLRAKPLQYTCLKGCVSRDEAKVDELIGQVVVEWLKQPAAAGVFDADDAAAIGARERLETLQARLDTAADAYAAGDIELRQLKRVTASLRDEITVAQTELQRHRRPALPSDIDALRGEEASGIWAQWDVQQRRAVLIALGLKVVIHPRGRRPGFDRRDIEITWSGGRAG